MNKYTNRVITNLSNGLKMPSIGLGTAADNKTYESVISAIKQGYRLIDTASGYLNEEEVGKALNYCFKENIVKREDLFICTKINGSEIEDPETALKRSLQKLNIDYLDLYLIHSPIGKVDSETRKLVKQTPLHKTWAKLEEAYDNKLIKSIGVSNFNLQLLLDLLSYARIKPTINQVEFHPYLQQKGLLDFCNLNEVEIMAYNPLCLGAYTKSVKDKAQKQYSLFDENIIKKLSEKYNKSPAQIVLNWHIYKGVIVIPKSSNEKRQLENISIFDFELSEDELKEIDSLEEGKRFITGEDKAWSADLLLFSWIITIYII